MDFSTYLSHSKGLIEKYFSEIIQEKRQDYAQRIGLPTSLFETLKEFMVGGKGLRGSLFLLTAEAYSNLNTDNKTDLAEELIAVACSLELMHSALLIHDDIMDGDVMRRGKKTLHTSYQERGQNESIKNPERYGISMGLIIGDIALFMAEELMACYKGQHLQKLAQFYGQELRLVGIGQMLDYSYGVSQSEVEMEDIKKMYIYKSARYSFTLPFVLGAIASGQEGEEIKNLEELGEKIGMIFQLVDDDIGMFGDEEKIGKSVGSDIRENKKTLMRSMLMQKANDKQREFLNELYGKSKVGYADVESAKQIIVDLGVRDEIKNMINELSQEAKDIIERLQTPNEYRNIFNQLVDYNTKRIF